MKRKCKLKSCSRYVLALGYCTTHYHRIKYYGGVMAHIPIRSHNWVGGLSPEYTAWIEMKRRCRNKKRAGYKNYGGRGIKVCKRWANPKNFLKDMGKRPRGHSLDRINNNRGYSPYNCRWATRKQQGNNKRNTLRASEIRKIRSLHRDGLNYSEISRKIGRSIWTVSRYVRGEAPNVTAH